MPTGERGFTYLALLLALAIGGAGAAALGLRWQTQAQREREAELAFRGAEIRRAIARYWAAQAPHELPPDLDALLADDRAQPPRHHLRRRYADPFSGRPDWTPVPDPASGRLAGVASAQARWQFRTGGPVAFVFEPPAEATTP